MERLSAYHIGFVLGPCINASGRLDHGEAGAGTVECEGRAERPVVLAEDLKALNDSRKEMTEKGVKEAVQMIESTPLREDKVLVVYLPDCHESIAGIIAGRIKERYYRPTFVLTRAEEGVKGSGRSIESYDMFAHMCRCQALFTRFGDIRWRRGCRLRRKMWNGSGRPSTNWRI